MDGHNFWTYAEGLSRGKLSPTEYNKQRERDLLQESEKRLKNYFFRDIWKGIPQAIQKDIKNIDKIWLAEEEIGLGSILENLKLITEGLLRPLVWEKFIIWRNYKTKEKGIYLNKYEVDFSEKIIRMKRKIDFQPDLSDFIEVLKLPSFMEFMKSETSLSDGEKNFLISLSDNKEMKELRHKRWERAHPPKDYPDWQRQEIAPLLNKFFGINTEGILPKLVKIMQKAGYGVKS